MACGGNDADGDVLYLARGESNEASDAILTPEGHGVRYGANGEVISVTIIRALTREARRPQCASNI